jgi:hypothetical protein
MKVKVEIPQADMHLLSELLGLTVVAPINLANDKRNLQSFVIWRTVQHVFMRHFNRKIFDQGQYAIALEPEQAAALYLYLDQQIKRGSYDLAVVDLFGQLDQALTNLPTYTENHPQNNA